MLNRYSNKYHDFLFLNSNFLGQSQRGRGEEFDVCWEGRCGDNSYSYHFVVTRVLKHNSYFLAQVPSGFGSNLAGF